MTTNAEVTVVGNLTRDPELRYTESGRAVVQLGVASNRRFNAPNHPKADEKGWVEVTSFFNVNAWAYLAENAAASLTKGMRVIISGRLEQRSWENDEGEKRSVVEITADAIGPDLTFATATVEKVSRSNGTQARFDDDPRAYQGQPVTVGAGEEEPF